MIRVLIVDDHEMMLDGLVTALALQSDIEVVSTATSVQSGLDRFRALAPDVTVTDYRIGDGTGAELCRSILIIDSGAAVVAVSALDDSHTVTDLFEAGCSAFVPKSNGVGELSAAIRAVHEGSIVFPRHIVDAARSEGGQSTENSLTNRELEVLQLLGTGRQVTEIANDLHLSTHTVRSHVRKILRKLGVSSQLNAVIEAARQGIIAKPGPAA